MIKSFLFIAICCLVLTTAAAATWTPNTSSWDYSWDFDNGLQGWTISGNAGAAWIDPAVSPNGPSLPDGGTSGAGGGNVYLPDGGKAELNVSSMNLGSGPGARGFQLWARVYVPNLSPLTGFNFGYPGNMISKAGVAAVRSDGKEMYVGGDIGAGRIRGKDRTWDNTSRGPSWTIEELGSVPAAQWWDKWVTLAFDYNYTVPGKWNAAAYIPWDSPVAAAGWVTLAENYNCTDPNNPAAVTILSTLRLGTVDGTSWTQAQFDDVKLKLAAVPEPSSMLALASGLFGMAGIAIRRRR